MAVATLVLNTNIFSATRNRMSVVAPCFIRLHDYSNSDIQIRIFQIRQFKLREFNFRQFKFPQFKLRHFKLRYFLFQHLKLRQIKPLFGILTLKI